MAKREGITKKLRFEVFKRDRFTCQYCGRMAPDVVLNLDHIKPVADGGKSTLLNLVTSCFDCNAGKSDRLLSDDAVVKKQQAQLLLLAERREQAQMVAEWAKELEGVKDFEVQKCEDVILDRSNRRLTDIGKKGAKKLVKKYGLQHVLKCIHLSCDTYLKYEGAAIPSTESVQKAWARVSDVCYWHDQPEEKRALPYLWGVMDRNFTLFDRRWASKTCAILFSKGHTVEEMLIAAKNSYCMQDFEEEFD